MKISYCQFKKYKSHNTQNLQAENHHIITINITITNQHLNLGAIATFRLTDTLLIHLFNSKLKLK